MSVAQAISSWTSISNSVTSYNSANGTNIKLVSPAVSDDIAGRNWLSSFMSSANANGLKVDAIAFHWYGDSSPTQLRHITISSAASIHTTIHTICLSSSRSLPFTIGVAITPMSKSSIANEQFLNMAIPTLDSLSYVAGYSWFNWFSDSPLYSTNGSTLTPNEMGYQYIAQVGTFSTSDISGSGATPGQNLGQKVADLTGGTLTMNGTNPGTISYMNALTAYSTIWGHLIGDFPVRITGSASDPARH